MLIRVQYTGGKYDYVNAETLDDKILTGEIAKFARATGWAVVGRDRIRVNNTDSGYYFGPERRYPIN